MNNNKEKYAPCIFNLSFIETENRASLALVWAAPPQPALAQRLVLQRVLVQVQAQAQAQAQARPALPVDRVAA